MYGHTQCHGCLYLAAVATSSQLSSISHSLFVTLLCEILSLDVSEMLWYPVVTFTCYNVEPIQTILLTSYKICSLT